MPQVTKSRNPTASDAVILADPELFAWYACGVDMWWKQLEIMESLQTWRRVAVKACNSSSKTKTAAIAALWWVSAYQDMLASSITTSSSWAQVEKVIWKEIHACIFEAAKRGFRYPVPNQTDLVFPSGGFLHGMSTNDAVNFHGFHGQRVLFVKDESTGIEPAIHEAIDSVAAGGHVVQLDLGNPVTTSGAFNDLFTNPLVKRITIDAFESPNFILHEDEAHTLEHKYGRNALDAPVDGMRFLTINELCTFGDADQEEGGFLDHYEMEPLGGKPRSYLTTRRWVWEVYRKYGIDSPYWQSHVRGQFPNEGTDTLIPATWIESARLAPAVRSVPFEAGLDVAGPGNAETVLSIRAGMALIKKLSWQGLSSEKTIAAVVNALLPYKPHLKCVNVDSVVIGYHMCGALSALGLPVVPVNVGLPASPGNQQRFANLKAEAYWGLRVLFEDTHEAMNAPGTMKESAISLASLDASDVLFAQLASLKFSETDRGQMIMERKKDLKKRGVSSPDHAESVMLCYITMIQRGLDRSIHFASGTTPTTPSHTGPSRYAARMAASRYDRKAELAASLYADIDK